MTDAPPPLEKDLPPWPAFPEGWDFDKTAIVPRRTSTLFVGAIVFIKTDNRVYRRRWNGAYYAGVGGPIERYTYEPRKIAGETRVSWLLASRDGMPENYLEKVPKRDVGVIFGLADVEDALWISAHQSAISRAVGALTGPKAFEQLQAIAMIVGVET